ncbi:MAG: hypothetical protein R3B57_13400 [Phycisphaerales bacterium]
MEAGPDARGGPGRGGRAHAGAGRGPDPRADRGRRRPPAGGRAGGPRDRGRADRARVLRDRHVQLRLARGRERLPRRGARAGRGGRRAAQGGPRAAPERDPQPAGLPSGEPGRAGEPARGRPLFETSAVFAQAKGRQSRGAPHARCSPTSRAEAAKRTADDKQLGVRQLRGAIEAIIRATHGPAARVTLEPAPSDCPGWDARAFARVLVDNERIGSLGLVSEAAQARAGLDLPVVAAELDLAPLLAAYPPRASAHALPAFPPIERDLSLIVPEDLAWARVESLVEGAGLERLEGCSFVGTYRGKQVGEGKKSVTLRLRFRDPSRTLRHEEVDPQVEAVVASAKRELGAEVRA